MSICNCADEHIESVIAEVRAGDLASLGPWADSLDDAGDAEVASAARGLGRLLGDWRAVVGAGAPADHPGPFGEPPGELHFWGPWLTDEVRGMLGAGPDMWSCLVGGLYLGPGDGWSLTGWSWWSGPGPVIFRTSRVLIDRGRDGAVAAVLRRPAELAPLLECAARALGLSVIELTAEGEGPARVAYLNKGQRAPAWPGPAAKCVIRRPRRR